ncbi:hypothetical protein M6D81_08520 [Paenibacillus sp. J5C_2022]|uniref:hypothetical protein n=1 Tax=Paenibacillus sp. J5C2022 TaxID=2977129 RepID=UPI0021D3094E|nr:hypothetical protein [Paenibacillus sp. J5C2022]MCU6708761.1 hypothetical protein [Paenibacillus sp. J5C2022]
MNDKLICILLLIAAVLVSDIPAYREAYRKERIVYGVLWVPLLYLNFLFITDLPWPNLDMLIDLFAGPAAQFVHWLKA